LLPLRFLTSEFEAESPRALEAEAGVDELLVLVRSLDEVDALGLDIRALAAAAEAWEREEVSDVLGDPPPTAGSARWRRE
jgi:hypothetical protein